MKQCPECRTVYTDAALRFCVNDGATLTEAAGGADVSEETAILPRASEETVLLSPRGKNPLRIDIVPSDLSAPTVIAAAQNSQPPHTPPNALPVGKNSKSVIFGVLGTALLLLLGGGALVAFVLFRSSDGGKTVEDKKVAAVSPSPSSSVSTGSSSLSTSADTPTPTVDAAQLRAELANLQKQIQDQKNQKQTAAPAVGSTPKQQTSSTTQSAPREARANSPRDGFLALRDEPNSESGYRVAQIPHGAIITVLGCPRASNVGKIPGRWCQVVYNGQSGWAFDAFISF